MTYRTLIFLLALTTWGQQRAARDRIVVLISIDGFPAYMLRDERLAIPNLRKLMAEGAFADRMIPVNPVVTWPNHTSMVTGVAPRGHGVLYNGMLLREAAGMPRVEPWRDKAEMVRAPTVYDIAHQGGLTTGEIDWVAVQNPGTIAWSFAERPKSTDPIPLEMIRAGSVTKRDIDEFAKSNIIWRDLLWTKAAVHIIEKHRPNLLLFHLLNTDSSHHRYGPRSHGGNSALALADARVGDVMAALDRSGLKDRATVLVVSDHGFKAVKTHIAPNALLRAKGLADAWVVPEGGTAMVYVTNPAAKNRMLPELRELFLKVEGVDRVIGENEFEALGLPQAEGQMADLVLSAKDGYAFIGDAAGEAIRVLPEVSGSHGYLATDPEMHAIFIAWGYGIRSGARLDEIRTVDLAPTIAALLGLRLPNVSGKALEEALALPVN